MSQSQSKLNLAKANFDSSYVGVTPIAYMQSMKSVGYEIPQNACRVFRKLIRHLEQVRGRPLRILDVGCSYGVNASLLRYEIELCDLYSHYSGLAHLEEEQSLLLQADEEFFGQLRPRVDSYFIGIDASANAISYATRSGVLDGGLAMDLERDYLDSPRIALAVDLIITTGTIGYIGPRALTNILRLCSDPSKIWFASFALRLIDFEPFAQVLSDWGMATEGHPQLFKQRLLADEREQIATAAYAQSQGMSVEGLEDTGTLFSKFYLSRAAKPNAEPLAGLLDS
jgi:SAM-dependent methyltransferase